MKSLFSLLVCFSFSSSVYSQDIPSYTFESLDQKLADESSGQYLIVNFWATWCKPCIKELPYFESITDELQREDIYVLLVSLDMDKEKAETYAQNKALQSEVVYLDETDFNTWIDKVSKEWTGAIPATLFLAPGNAKSFFEGSFEKEELINEVKRFIENNPKS